MAKNQASPPEQPVTPTPIVAGRTRSPNYPIYRLDTAIKKAEALIAAFKSFQVPVAAAAKTLGFSTASSSSAAQAIAALRAYGLIDVTGSGADRKIAVSDTAAKIIGKHSDREKLLRQAALAPAIHAELFKKFVTADGIAPDPSINQYLRWDRSEGRFNQEVVDVVIRQFKSTLAFAGLDSSGKMSGTDDEIDPPGVSEGDFVQWESQGVAQFLEPRRVTGKSDDGQWLFVDGSPTGLPLAEVHRVDTPKAQQMNQEIIEASSQGPPPNPKFKPIAPTAGMKQDTFTTDTGSVVVQWPSILSSADLEDLENWLDMLKRKIKRSVKSDEPN